jgi:hypothetical protein
MPSNRSPKIPDKPMLARNSSGVILLRDDMDKGGGREIWENSWA